MNIRERIKNTRVILDGGMGTLLQAKGLAPGEAPEYWNIPPPEVITEIQRAYYEAGCDVVNTNTFGVNSLKYDDDTLSEMVRCAIKCADDARKLAGEYTEKAMKSLQSFENNEFLKALTNKLLGRKK